ncbi:MAG: FG-GAP-like repeat-containing protein [Woeseiaceae bacterium]|nr:FG-GAP-like repeat-containing protein [Woeseiaceae bacterium]
MTSSSGLFSVPGASRIFLLTILLAATAAHAAPPSVTIDAPSDGSTFNAGVNINFQGTASDPGEDGDISASLDWSSNLDGAIDSGASINVSTLSAGTHLITAAVTDSGGESGDATITVTVNALPTVTITNPSNGSNFNFGDSINFQASATDAEDDNASLTNTITWSSNLDGALAGSGGSIPVSTLSIGTHTITASVTDSNGAAASDAISVTINNNAPTVTITNPSNGSNFNSGASINFVAAATDVEDDDATLTDQIAWSSNVDGALGTSGSLPINTLSIGVHTITASVTDSNSGSDSDTITVTIANNPPTVTILAPGNGSSFDFGELINFAASATDVEDDNTALTNQITWLSNIDGALPAGANGATSTDTLSIGTHTITASVTDSDGGPGSDSITITIANNAPTVTITAPSNGTSANFGTNINFVANATDAEDDDAALTAAIAWTSNLDGALGTGGSINVSDLGVGVHTITASVTDSDGGPGADSIGVTITNNAPVLNAIGPQSVIEGAAISIPLSATDADGQALVLSSTALPTFCDPLVDNGNGTGAINCSPTIGDAGDYAITVTVSDPVPETDDETFTLTVVGNEPPVASDVAITGTLALTEILTGTYTYSDAEGDLEGLTTFRWLRDGTPIPGETGTTHTVVAADVEAALVFEVTPVALTGALTGSPVQSPEVTVNNVAPSITGQDVLETAEDTAIVVTLDNLTVDDSDNTYPDDFTIAAANGPDWTQAPAPDGKSVTITPLLDFAGDLTVPVTVNDGVADSPPFDLLITVTAVNDAPVITGLVAPLSTPEDTPIDIEVTDLEVTDPDNTFPTDFTLTLQNGANYTVDGNTVTPAENFNGQISIPATVNDGELNSAVFNIPVTVTSVNDVPVLETPIGGQQAVEDSPFNLDVSGNFSDPEGDTLTFSANWSPARPSAISLSSRGVFSGTPRAADEGIYTVQVRATDPSGDFASDTFDLTISLRDRANLSLAIEVAPESGNPGDDLRWTLTARNPVGPQPGQNVELIGSFVGAGLTVSAEGGANCTLQPTVNNVTGYVCVLGTLPVGGNNATVFTTTTSEVSEVVAFATAAGAQADPIDPNLEDNSAFLAAAVADAFSVGAVQILGNSAVHSVTAGDVNGDGLTDLVAGTAAGQAVQVFVNAAQNDACQCQRDFSVAPISVPGTNSGSNDGVALADFDGNGTLDLVVVNGGGQADMVYSNDGSGNFSPMATLGNSFGQAVAVGDFNNDGNRDIAIAAVGGNPVYHGNGNGGFNLHATLGNANSLDVAVAEFDANGRDDLVFANAGSASRVWTKNSGAGFSSADQLNIGDAVAVAAGQLNGDQRPDLVFGRVPNDVDDVPANPVFINNGNGTFPNAPEQLLGISPTNDVHIGDLDRDGLQDIVFVNASGVHQIWTQTGSWSLHREQIIDGGAVAGVLADMGDITSSDSGGIDLAMGGALGGGLAVYLNDGAGNLGRGDTEVPVITLLGSTSVVIESGDRYIDAGATASDNIDGDITSAIRVTGSVNTASVGTYTLTYDVSDFAGNAAVSVSRSVRVDPSAGSGGGGGGSLSPWTLLALFAASLAVLYRRKKVLI